MCRHARVSCTTRVTRQHAGVHGALLAHGALLLAHACARSCARCHASVHTRVCSHTHTPACTLPLHTSMFLWGTLSVHTPKMLPPACTSTSRCPHVCTHTHTHPVCSHPALPPDCSVGLRAHAFPLLFLHTCTRTDLPHRACTRMPTAISVHTHKPTLLHTPHTPLCTLFPPPACTLTPSTVLHSRTHACTPRALHTNTHTHSLVQAPPACTHTAAPQAPTSCTRLHTPCPCTPQHPPHCSHLHAQLRARTRVCSARPAFHACTPAPTPLHARSPHPCPRPPPAAPRAGPTSHGGGGGAGGAVPGVIRAPGPPRHPAPPPGILPPPAPRTGNFRLSTAPRGGN